MKKITIILLLSLIAPIANASTELDRQSYCASYGVMFQTIAAWRDQGSSPERTLELIMGIKGISIQEKKDAISAVYTDKTYAGERGPALGHKMRQQCLTAKMK